MVLVKQKFFLRNPMQKAWTKKACLQIITLNLVFSSVAQMHKFEHLNPWSREEPVRKCILVGSIIASILINTALTLFETIRRTNPTDTIVAEILLDLEWWRKQFEELAIEFFCFSQLWPLVCLTLEENKRRVEQNVALRGNMTAQQAYL